MPLLPAGRALPLACLFALSLGACVAGQADTSSGRASALATTISRASACKAGSPQRGTLERFLATETARGASADPAYPLDGASLLPVLRDPRHTFARPLHWRMNHRGQRALRDGDWKYLRVDGVDQVAGGGFERGATIVGRLTLLFRLGFSSTGSQESCGELLAVELLGIHRVPRANEPASLG